MHLIPSDAALGHEQGIFQGRGYGAPRQGDRRLARDLDSYLTERRRLPAELRRQDRALRRAKVVERIKVCADIGIGAGAIAVEVARLYQKAEGRLLVDGGAKAIDDQRSMSSRGKVTQTGPR